MTSPLDPRLAALINPELLFAEPERFTDMGFWHQHVPFAFVLTDLLEPRSYVELGAHKGDSYCAFCQAVVKLGLPTRCHAVDTWSGDLHTSAYAGSVHDELKAWHDARYARFSTLMRMRFDEAAAAFAPGSVDLLHIDGTHTYEAVRHDFETWLPKMSERGVILFHDTNVHSETYGVWKLWQEIRDRHPHFEFLHGNGLGVLATGPALPAKFRAFLEFASHNPDAVRSLFEAFGQRVARRALVEAQGAKLAALESAHATLQKDAARAGAELGELARAHAVLIEQRRALDERLAALETQYRSETGAARADIARLSNELQSVYLSSSWKFSAPLRWLGRLLRGG